MKNSCSPTLVPRQVLHIGAKLFVLFVKNKYRDWDLLSSNDVCVKRTNFQEGYIYMWGSNMVSSSFNVCINWKGDVG